MKSNRPRHGERKLRREVLVSLLKQGLGQHVAESLFAEVAQRLNLGPEEFSERDAQRLFEELANYPGLPGIVARFAKSRLCLLGTGVGGG